MTPALVQPEPMSAAFLKFHLARPCVLHRFSAPDHGDPHDHPWPFSTTILTGGYVEEVYTITAAGWIMERHQRRAGETHQVGADTIHRIVELPASECWTAIEPGAWIQRPGFWRLRNGQPQRRQWDQGWPA